MAQTIAVPSLMSNTLLSVPSECITIFPSVRTPSTSKRTRRILAARGVVTGSEFRVQSSEFRVQSSEFSVHGSGFLLSFLRSDWVLVFVRFWFSFGLDLRLV